MLQPDKRMYKLYEEKLLRDKTQQRKVFVNDDTQPCSDQLGMDQRIIENQYMKKNKELVNTQNHLSSTKS